MCLEHKERELIDGMRMEKIGLKPDKDYRLLQGF
jgi:hypothetical protein